MIASGLHKIQYQAYLRLAYRQLVESVAVGRGGALAFAGSLIVADSLLPPSAQFVLDQPRQPFGLSRQFHQPFQVVRG